MIDLKFRYKTIIMISKTFLSSCFYSKSFVSLLPALHGTNIVCGELIYKPKRTHEIKIDIWKYFDHIKKKYQQQRINSCGC